MNISKRLLFAALCLCAAALPGCRHRSVRISGEDDSLSYAIGLSVGYNLLRMDSTLNAEAVCAAIRDVYAGTATMSVEEARDYFLAQKTYFVHERALAYQEQFLADLSKRDRSYVRTRTGVTYKIITLGDQSVQSMQGRDTLKICYTLRDDTGRTLREADTVRLSFRDLPAGLQEVVRIAGDGASFKAWLPSSTAYDSAGNDELGVGANQLLDYDVQILNIDYYNINRRNRR